MKLRCHIQIVVYCLIVLSWLIGCADSSQNIPVAEQGLIDLSQIDFHSTDNIELTGQWIFVKNKFVEPLPVDELLSTYTGRLNVPGPWSVRDNFQALGGMSSSKGFGTYALVIHLPERTEFTELGILATFVNTAATWLIYSEDGQTELARMQQGGAAEDKLSSRPVWIPALTDWRMGDERRLLLLVHLSNFENARGGILNAPKLGLKNSVERSIFSWRLMNAANFGILLIIAFYHFVVFALRPQDIAVFYFGLLSLVMAIRQWLTGRHFQELGIGLSPTGYDVLVTIDYMSVPCGMMGFGLFTLALVPQPLFRRFVRWVCVGGGLGLVLMALVTNLEFISSDISMLLLYVHALGVTSGILIHLFYCSMKRNKLAQWMLGAFGIVVVGVLNDVLYVEWIIRTAYISNYTFIGFLLVQSGILAANSANAFRQAEYLGENLKEEVNVATKSLREQKDKSNILRLEAEVQAESLQELDRQKTQFFQNVSHELRTPLTLLLNPLEYAEEMYPDDSNLKTASRNARRLVRLVNQLLDFQKLEAGRQSLELRELNVASFIMVCADYFRSISSNKGITFKVSTKVEGQSLCEEQNYIMANLDALEKVIFNYLSNALKFTPAGGGIELGVDQSQNLTRIYVKDTGIGILEADQSKLFHVFNQIDNTATRNYEGTGIGLALVAGLVTKMNGTFGVESELGKGSAFWVQFSSVTSESEIINPNFEPKKWLVADGEVGETIGRSPANDSNTVTTHATLNDDKRMPLVMVVDDLEDMRNLITNSLSRVGYRTCVAFNGQDGFDKALEKLPDLIITDWMMPQVHGPDLIQNLKDDARCRAIPVILLTAKSDEESKLLGTQAGASAFLGKPFNDAELLSVVNNLLALKARERELEELLDKLKASELRLAAQSRLATMGQMIDGVSHEIGNPLNFLQGGLEVARTVVDANDENETLRFNPQFVKGFTMAERATERIVTVLENLRCFMTDGKISLTAVDMKSVVESTHQFLQHELNTKNIKVVMHFDSVQSIRGNSGGLGQVVLNLMLNAIQAIESNGTIFLHLENQNDFVVFRIRDSGPGIPEEIRDEVFEPFFTTKHTGEGTGLGLSIVRDLVKTQGGSVELKSGNGGAEFCVFLPVYP